jgi:gamma-glutamyltranspeptidase/glutathione hydrolase
MIQSNYTGFGSGLVVPATGIALHNRGCNFNLIESHPNCLRAGNRPYHTIIPGFMTRKGRALGAFGVMGAFMQPQGQLQVVMNMFDFGMNPQEALDAPRWQWIKGKTIHVEQGVQNSLLLELAAKGHDIHVQHDTSSFGRGQIIVKTQYGTLAGATEPRTDGEVAAW